MVGGTGTVSATATSGLAVTYSTTSPTCSVNAATGLVTGISAGTCTIAANQAGNGTYNAAAQVTQSLTVNNKVAQTITFGAAPSVVVGGTGTVSATATSGLAVTYSTTSPTCSVNATTGVVTGISAGTCTIAADQAGNATYNAAAQATQSFTVTAAGFALTVTPAGSGTGTVASTPAGISCGATCAANFNSGSSVSLAATPSTGSIFAGWSGACTGTGSCSVTMDAAKSVTATFNLATSIPRLYGISTRSLVLTGGDVMIGGFIIGGSSPKTVVVRARGPSLGVAGALADPTLTLVPASGPVLTNDDWQTDPNAAALSASGFAPGNAKESAILATFNPGAYTAIVSGVGNTTGVAIMEVYEIDHPEIPLVGISTRARVQTGGNVMIGGFIIQGSSPQTVVVRARGPSLASQGVTGALQNPVLQLVSAADGTVITNDDWATDVNAGLLQASGYAPTDPRESAILITLNPGRLHGDRERRRGHDRSRHRRGLQAVGRCAEGHLHGNFDWAGSGNGMRRATAVFTHRGRPIPPFEERLMRACLDRCVVCLGFLLLSLSAQANFHLFTISEIFSNADATVQFVELTTAFAGQQSLAGHTLTATSGSTTRTFTFPTNLPGDTLGKRFLVGTQGFAALGLVTPDYIVPDGFLFVPGGTVDFAGVDIWTYGSLPSDGNLSLNRNGTTSPNSPTNFAGVTGQITSPPFALSVSLAGTGTGTVTSSPAGIDCGSTCSAGFNSGASVTLTANAAPGSAFSGWSGVTGCSGTVPCVVTVIANTTVTATFAPISDIPRLSGISTRGQVLTGGDVMIGGFIIGGSTPKTVVVRARGPSLASQGVAGALADPMLTLVPASGTVLTNDDWQADPNAAALAASGFQPGDAKESAILATLDPGAYTAIVSGVGNTTGVAIVEVYEIDHPEIPLIGISTRGQVQTGGNVMIGGFIIQGSSPQTVVVRARGPSLASQGVTGTLQNPMLQLVSATDGSVITQRRLGHGANAGLFPVERVRADRSHGKPPILITLNPGAYTAIVTGAAGTTGVGIVEVFKQ